MKFMISILAVIALGVLMQLMFPWWIIAVAAFIVGLLIYQADFSAFLAGFLGIALLWTGYAVVINFQNDALLAKKIAMLFQLNSAWLVIVITALIGGITAGFAALSGSYLRKLLQT